MEDGLKPVQHLLAIAYAEMAVHCLDCNMQNSRNLLQYVSYRPSAFARPAQGLIARELLVIRALDMLLHLLVPSHSYTPAAKV